MATGTGNLPNPGMSFSPFAILTAEEQNQLVANIESLATGTGIGDGAITGAKLGLAATPAGTGWSMRDFGAFKRYTRQFTGSSVTIGANANSALVSSAALPTGVSSLTGATMTFSVGMQFTYAFVVLQEAVTPQSATSLSFICWNGGTGASNTGNWKIDVVIEV